MLRSEWRCVGSPPVVTWVLGQRFVLETTKVPESVRERRPKTENADCFELW
ncbi:MAG: hypothetical protein ABSB22_13185 [Thermodesulfobacteriota bacterium]